MILFELRALLEEYYFDLPFIHHFNFICWHVGTLQVQTVEKVHDDGSLQT